MNSFIRVSLSPEQRVERERGDDAVQRPLPHQQPLSAAHRGLTLRQPAAQTLPQAPQLRIILGANAATGRGEPGLQTRRRGGGAHRGPSARHCLLSSVVCVLLMMMMMMMMMMTGFGQERLVIDY